MPEQKPIQEPKRFNPSDPGTTESPSLALKYLLGHLDETRWSKILDLGPAVGANVEFFTQYSCKLFIADLFQAFSPGRSSLGLGGGALSRRLQQDLPSRDQAPFDIILAWDLLNYLEPEEMETAGRHLAALCNPKGLLFALLSNHHQLPDRPISFGIVDIDTLAYDNRSTATRPSPHYREPDLKRHLPAFVVETSFLLRNGMQEYVLARRSSP
ncbi:MAG: hypothetical protein WBG64_16830 [Thermoanaerobaculia bacterium]